MANFFGRIDLPFHERFQSVVLLLNTCWVQGSFWNSIDKHIHALDALLCRLVLSLSLSLPLPHWKHLTLPYLDFFCPLTLLTAPSLFYSISNYVQHWPGTGIPISSLEESEHLVSWSLSIVLQQTVSTTFEPLPTPFLSPQLLPFLPAAAAASHVDSSTLFFLRALSKALSQSS